METKKRQKIELTKQNDEKNFHHGEYIKNEIYKLGINLSEYADKTGINRTYLSSKLSSKTLPNRIIRKICKGLNIDLEAVFGIENLVETKGQPQTQDGSELAYKYFELTEKFNNIVSENMELYKKVIKLHEKLNKHNIKFED